MPLTNAQYDALMRVYERRRTQNRRIEEERRAEAYAAIPQLSELDRQNALSALEKVRKKLFTPMQLHAAGGAAKPLLEKRREGQESDQAASSDAQNTEKKRRALLRENGFSEDWLDSVYTCPDCRDTGLVNGAHCHCFDREVVRLFYTQSNLAPILQKENFQTLSYDFYPEEIDPGTGRSARQTMESVVSVCKAFADRYPKEGGFLLLYGKTGLGKTFLSHCIAKQLIDNGRSVIYYSAGELFDDLARARFDREGQMTGTMASDLEYLRTCDLLIIDDLGTEMTNTFTASVFFRLLNERLSENRGMVISTNLSPAGLSQVYTERIYSRIVERFTILEMAGRDIRVQKRLRG